MDMQQIYFVSLAFQQCSSNPNWTAIVHCTLLLLVDTDNQFIDIFAESTTQLPLPANMAKCLAPKDPDRPNYIKSTKHKSWDSQLYSSLHSTCASWAGKIALAKMFLLPLLLYLFQTLPVPLLSSQIDTLQRNVNNFIQYRTANALELNTPSCVPQRPKQKWVLPT